MLRHELDRLFDGFAEGFPSLDTFGTFGARTFPAVNVWEDGATLYAEAEIPGLAMDQVDVSVLGDELTIKGERKDVGSKSVTHHRRERGVGSFVRVLRLPVEVDADKVEATLRDGVLTISLPKAQAALPRKIEVKG
jgi:HSP20 family protein